MDFSFLNNCMMSQPVSWDYRQRVLDRLKTTAAFLDMDTEGGGFLGFVSAISSKELRH